VLPEWISRAERFAALTRATMALVLCLVGVASSAGADGADLQRMARSAIAQGRLDPQVLAAIEAGEQPRVIVVGASRSKRGDSLAARVSETRRARARIRNRVTRELLDVTTSPDSVPVLAGLLSRRGLRALLSDPEVKRIGVDPVLQSNLLEVATAMGADVASSFGLTGNGVTVAVVDSGVDFDHPDLADDLVAEACFCNNGGPCCADGTVGIEIGPGSSDDDNGHGTHVAGIVTSRGVVAPPGIAPDARLISVRFAKNDPTDGRARGLGSDMIASLDWLLVHQPTTQIVNISHGFGEYGADCDNADTFTQTLSQVIELLWEEGVLVFAATGNDGVTNGKLPAPACLARVVSVAASYDADFGTVDYGICVDPTTGPEVIACISRRSSDTDLLAPGYLVTSTGLSGSAVAGFGTSQAAPAAAACAALMLERSPGKLAQSIAADLSYGPTIYDSVTGIDFPRVDCAAALNLPSGGLNPVIVEDFGSGLPSGWSQPDVDGALAFWTISSGELQGTGDATDTSNGGAHDSLFLTNVSFGPDFDFDFDLRYIAGASNPGDFGSQVGFEAAYAVARYVDNDNYIYFRIDPISGSFNKAQIRINDVVDGVARTLEDATIPFPAGSVGALSDVTLKMRDLRMTLYWDGDSFYDEWLPFINTSAGRVGVGIPEGTSVVTAGVSQFDNFVLSAPECSDGIDNDEDGQTDFPADPGCRDAAWESESPACDNGADDDADGEFDFPDDPDCVTAWRDSEFQQGSFPFFDDFGDGDALGWEVIDADGSAPSVFVSGRALQIRGDGDQAAIDSWALLVEPVAQDFVLDVDLRFIAGQSNPGDFVGGGGGFEAAYVLVRYVDPQNYIYLRVDPVNAGILPDAAILVREVVAGVATTLVNVTIPGTVPEGAPSTVEGHLQVRLEDLRLQLEWDGDQVYDQFLPFVNRGAGRIGLGVPEGSSELDAGVSQFDNVAVNVLPEPSILLMLATGLPMLFWLQRRRVSAA